MIMLLLTFASVLPVAFAMDDKPATEVDFNCEVMLSQIYRAGRTGAGTYQVKTITGNFYRVVVEPTGDLGRYPLDVAYQVNGISDPVGLGLWSLDGGKLVKVISPDGSVIFEKRFSKHAAVVDVQFSSKGHLAVLSKRRWTNGNRLDIYRYHQGQFEHDKTLGTIFDRPKQRFRNYISLIDSRQYVISEFFWQFWGESVIFTESLVNYPNKYKSIYSLSTGTIQKYPRRFW